MLTIVLSILLLIMAVFLTVAVLMQHGKSHNLSGTIAGGAETFFGKTKGRSVDAMISKLTTIVAIVFVILVVVLYIAQPNDIEYSAPADDIVVENGEVAGDDAQAPVQDDVTAPAEGENAELPADSTDVDGNDAEIAAEPEQVADEATPAE